MALLVYGCSAAWKRTRSRARKTDLPFDAAVRPSFRRLRLRLAMLRTGAIRRGEVIIIGPRRAQASRQWWRIDVNRLCQRRVAVRVPTCMPRTLRGWGGGGQLTASGR